MNIGLIGTGAYGQAMAMMLLKNNNDVIMWTENEDKYKFYKENNRIKSLINGIEIPKEIKLTNDIKEVCLNKDINRRRTHGGGKEKTHAHHKSSGGTRRIQAGLYGGAENTQRRRIPHDAFLHRRCARRDGVRRAVRARF